METATSNIDRLIIEPMRDDLLLWRCLHGGPLSATNIDLPAPNPAVDWTNARVRNIPLLKRLTTAYGACAIIARDGESVVATMRFYPKALCVFSDEGGAGFCLQQRFPAGPADDMSGRELPPLSELDDKTLFVHCMMIAAPTQPPDRYRRRGLATRMARELIRWASQRGWQAIEANAYEDLPFFYAIAGVAGRTFWEKLGFRIIHQDVEPGLVGQFLEAARKDAIAAGIPPERAANRFRMRLDLAAS